jgi:hypothetical protein
MFVAPGVRMKHKFHHPMLQSSLPLLLIWVALVFAVLFLFVRSAH